MRWGGMGVLARIFMGLAEQVSDKKTISIDASYPLPGDRCLQR